MVLFVFVFVFVFVLGFSRLVGDGGVERWMEGWRDEEMERWRDGWRGR